MNEHYRQLRQIIIEVKRESKEFKNKEHLIMRMYDIHLNIYIVNITRALIYVHVMTCMRFENISVYIIVMRIRPLYTEVHGRSTSGTHQV